MDSRPFNAALYVNSFNPTGNPGEYQFENAVFNNQADKTGNGAYDIQVGFVLYVPSTDFNTGAQLPGVVHRYRLTQVEVVDAQTVNGTVIWDETDQEGLEIPTNGIGCGLSMASPNLGLGYAPSDEVYSELTSGLTAQSVQTDLWNIVDQQQNDAGGPSSSYKTTIGDANALSFAIHHSLNDMDVSITVYELSTGSDVYPGIVRTGPDEVQLDFTYPIEANSHRVVVRS